MSWHDMFYEIWRRGPKINYDSICHGIMQGVHEINGKTLMAGPRSQILTAQGKIEWYRFFEADQDNNVCS